MAAALGVVVRFLSTHPDVQQALRDRPEDLAPAIDEMLRLDDPFLVNRRVTTRAVRIGEHELAAGTRVYLNWTSANRDENVFGDSDAWPERNAAQLVYGTGIRVPGRPLATMEGRRRAVAVDRHGAHRARARRRARARDLSAGRLAPGAGPPALTGSSSRDADGP
jgi:cytochrome P450